LVSLAAVLVILPTEAFAQVQVNDLQIRCAAKQLIDLLEGNLGALIMVIAGISSIIACAFGAYRAATSMIVVALGSFTLRSFVYIFFNVDLNIPASQCKHIGGSTIDLVPGGSLGASGGFGISKTFNIGGHQVTLDGGLGGSADAGGAAGGGGMTVIVDGVPVSIGGSGGADGKGVGVSTSGNVGGVGGGINASTGKGNASGGPLGGTAGSGQNQGGHVAVGTPVGGVGAGGGTTQTGSGGGAGGNAGPVNGSSGGGTNQGSTNVGIDAGKGNAKSGGVIIRHP